MTGDIRMDVTTNRTAQKWTWREQAGRVLWTLATPLFRLSPRPLWGWRRVLLRLFGARVGREVRIYPSVRIAIPWNLALGDGSSVGDGAILYGLGPITLGPRSTVSQYGHLCAGSHDWRDPAVPLTKPPISVGADVWIAADVFVGPGVTVGDGAILGARAVVMKDCPPCAILVGNPARRIGTRNVAAAETQSSNVTQERSGL